jgi:ribose-phosphate pyrophosphokinase
LSANTNSGILLGSDSESEQWVREIAVKIGFFSYAVATKIRSGDQLVEVSIPQRDYADQPVMLIDDVVSTGRTLAQASGKLLQTGARQIDVIITHPLFCSGAEQCISVALTALRIRPMLLRWPICWPARLNSCSEPVASVQNTQALVI